LDSSERTPTTTTDGNSRGDAYVNVPGTMFPKLPDGGLARDEAGVVAKFCVKLQSIPDHLAVLGNSTVNWQVCRDEARQPRP
jgi:hypothetical protein